MKEKSFFILVLFLVITLISSVAVETQLPPLIRLHVLANSNSEEDQLLKYKVRDEIIKEMSKKFAQSHSLEESREIVLKNLGNLEDIATQTLRDAGCLYNVAAQHGEYTFPTKYYGSFALPAGKYEAVRVVIGQGQGANWWCVLFPPLCFAEGQIQGEHTQEEVISCIKLEQPQEKVIKVKPAFKIVEVWENIVTKLNTD